MCLDEFEVISDTNKEKGLPGHPSERDKLAAGSKRGVVRGIQRSCHSALADLHSVAGEHKHISDKIWDGQKILE